MKAETRHAILLSCAAAAALIITWSCVLIGYRRSLPRPTPQVSVPTAPVQHVVADPPRKPNKKIVLPPKGKYEHGLEINIENDRFSGNVIASLRHQEPQTGLRLTVLSLHEIASPAPPDHIALGMWSHSERWKYLDHHDVTLLIDGSPLRCGEASHKGKIDEDGVSEAMWIDLSLETFIRLANSESAEAQLGMTEFTISRELRQAMLDFASRLPVGDTDDGSVEVVQLPAR